MEQLLAWVLPLERLLARSPPLMGSKELAVWKWQWAQLAELERSLRLDELSLPAAVLQELTWQAGASRLEGWL